MDTETPLALELRENKLQDCLFEISKRFLEVFQRKGVRLELYMDPSIPTFHFDYQKVQQVMANLLDNALKYTPSGGTVGLRAAPHFWERRELRLAKMSPLKERRRFPLPRPNCIGVSVKDSSVGIPAAHHHEVFEDVLGLAIAKRLVQAHRGKIWVDSDPNEGTRFTFLLPMDQG